MQQRELGELNMMYQMQNHSHEIATQRKVSKHIVGLTTSTWRVHVALTISANHIEAQNVVSGYSVTH